MQPESYPPPAEQHQPQAYPMPGQQANPAQRAGAQPHDGVAKGSALGIAFLIHLLILFVLTLIVLQSMKEDAPELVVESSNVEAPVKVDPKRFANAAKPEPSAPSMAKAMVVATMTASPVSVPAVEDTDQFEFGMGDAFGAGLGIGTGGSGGGGVGFFGSRSTASRVVFIVDVSASLSEKQFSMIKEELTKSLNRLAPNIQYQVIFFAGPAWFAEDEFVSKAKRSFTIKGGSQKYIWSTKGGAHMFELTNRKDLPVAKWRPANKANIHKTNKQIEKVKKIYGTDWEWPLKIALQQMEPKPDVIYFLTDGVTGDGEKTLEEIAKINRGKGKKAKINTIAMMQPRAASLLRKLAKDAGGQFTIVNADGSTTVDKMRGDAADDRKGKGKGKGKGKK